MRVVSQRGLTTRQIAQLVQRLLAAAPEQWPGLLEQASSATPAAGEPKGGAARRTPGEQLVAAQVTLKF